MFRDWKLQNADYRLHNCLILICNLQFVICNCIVDCKLEALIRHPSALGLMLHWFCWVIRLFVCLFVWQFVRSSDIHGKHYNRLIIYMFGLLYCVLPLANYFVLIMDYRRTPREVKIPGTLKVVFQRALTFCWSILKAL